MPLARMSAPPWLSGAGGEAKRPSGGRSAVVALSSAVIASHAGDPRASNRALKYLSGDGDVRLLVLVQ